ncbi:hypothetical protein [Comamonas sp. lk]|uniref:hypothetical protein n=1 Tax=Comamonas sp. lk TaxID=2201272 RepID=UPI000EAE8152|nr:hypothetical protein [Comamonas sp. lk]
MDQSAEKHSGLSLISRLAAAVLGGYALASAWVVMCGALGAARVEAVLGGVQSSWLWYVAAVIWAFSPVAPRRVWAVLGGATVVLLSAAALLTAVRG